MSVLCAGSRIKRLLAVTAAILFAAAPLSLSTAEAAHAATTPGASVPFTEYLAASNATTNGTVLPAGYRLGTLQAEATGRQAVELTAQGQYVQFTLTSSANAVDIHYAIPDSSSGGGLTEPLDLYAGGTLSTALSLTSNYSWLYGAYPYSNTPSVGEPGGTSGSEVPHDFYNDVRYIFPQTLAQGTVVKLQVDSGDAAPWYAIDTADFETVAPIAQPPGYISATAAPYDADPTGANDSTSALQNAINAASSAGEGLYLPQGTYKVSSPLNVDNVTIEGAGEWYTTLTGSNVEFSGNQNPASTNVNVSNLALFGQVDTRDNSSSANTGFNGGFSNSTINQVWIQNEKSGIFDLGPATGLTAENMRIQDLTADGINLDAANGAVTGSTIQNNFLRNTGDDGIALWSQSYADTSDTVTQNTVDSPNLANNLGVYGGGSGDQITNNLLQDTVEYGGGIEIAQNYGAVAFSGTLTVSGNELVRTGQFDPGWDYGTGAIWIYPAQANMSSTINITGNTILDSPYEAFMFQNSNHYSGSATLTAPNTGYSVTGVSIQNNTVTNVGTFVFQDQAPGSATVSGTTATGVGDAGIFTCGSGFTLNQGSGDSGFTSTACAMPTASPLWVYPGPTTFQGATVGQSTSAQQVAIMNTSSAATTLGTISASSGFSVQRDPTYPCGSSLDAAAVTDAASWCMVDVTFTPAAAGTTIGTLSVASSQSTTATLQLIGTATGSSGGGSTDLALNKSVTASTATSGFPASNAVDGNTGSYWESTDGSWPATLTVDLGASDALGSVTIALPSGWPTRTQTLSVLGSTDGSSWTTLVGSATYTWSSSNSNDVSITLPSGSNDRYVELNFTANNVQNGAQVAELGVYA
ncbi:discoidin domain-containing protein [Actinospica sp.]|uniref:discoidin domain-containing protein n=1 Tax=Actinospica sp. TaxID=1872142 RepID=UPI002B9521FD|nr:discoidin domain-containing protein [Actinospica sp.]HWG26640.1 discoidin domain-containing protein [Actinospica sp.]